MITRSCIALVFAALVWTVGLSGSARAQYGMNLLDTEAPHSVLMHQVSYAAWQPPAADYSHHPPGWFYNCHLGSFAIQQSIGRALFKTGPGPVAVDAHLKYFTETPGYFWYVSEDKLFLFALAKRPNCGGGCSGGCGHHCSPHHCHPHHGYSVWIYRNHHGHWHWIQHCCASRSRIVGLFQASMADGDPLRAPSPEQLPMPMQ